MQQFDKGTLIIIASLFIFNTFSFPKTKVVSTRPAALAEFKQWPSAPLLFINPLKNYRAVITTTTGEMRINLFAKAAPQTVNSFIFLAQNGFYDGMRFYRVIKNFIVETGDPLETGRGGAGYRFASEPTTGEFSRGVLVAGNPGTNAIAGPFFIAHRDFDWPKEYAIFGAIAPDDTRSLQTLDVIAQLPVGPNVDGEVSFPLVDALISKITIEEY